MSTPASLEAQLNSMERVEPVVETPPVSPPAPEPETPLNVEDDAAVDAALEANAIRPPDGEALIPSADVGKVGQAYRAQLKAVKAERDALKEGSAKVPELERKIAELSKAVQRLTPYVQAYQQLAQPQPVAPKEPEIPDTEAEQYARTYDLYKPDGSGALDLDRGRKIVGDMRRIAKEAATEAARAEVAPVQQQTITDRSNYMVARAKNTVFPNGATLDPGMMDLVASRVSPDITASPEGMQQAMIAALGYTVATMTPAQLLAYAQAAQGRQRGADGKFVPQAAAVPQQIPDPVPREPAGGQPPNQPTQLTETERKFLSQTGMSEADYLKTAGTRFGGR